MKYKILDMLEELTPESIRIANEVAASLSKPSGTDLEPPEGYANIALSRLFDEVDSGKEIPPEKYSGWLATVIRNQMLNDIDKEDRKEKKLKITHYEDWIDVGLQQRLESDDDKEFTKSLVSTVEGKCGAMMRFCYANSIAPNSSNGKHLISKYLDLNDATIRQRAKRFREKVENGDGQQAIGISNLFYEDAFNLVQVLREKNSRHEISKRISFNAWEYESAMYLSGVINHQSTSRNFTTNEEFYLYADKVIKFTAFINTSVFMSDYHYCIPLMHLGRIQRCVNYKDLLGVLFACLIHGADKNSQNIQVAIKSVLKMISISLSDMKLFADTFVLGSYPEYGYLEEIQKLHYEVVNYLENIIPEIERRCSKMNEPNE